MLTVGMVKVEVKVKVEVGMVKVRRTL